MMPSSFTSPPNVRTLLQREKALSEAETSVSRRTQVARERIRGGHRPKHDISPRFAEDCSIETMVH
jgi:hypothetical protein